MGVTGVISTIEAKCKDCYKCLRSCPVKAIRIAPGGSGELAAQVVDELCIMDGACVKQCPQNAKRVRDDTSIAKALLAGRSPVIASLAPSFVAGLPVRRPMSVVTALKNLGFAGVQETAVGASLVASHHRHLVDHESRLVISTACPVAVNLIERYYPGTIPFVAPLVSPMVAHARFLKLRYPGARVVFIGPCFGKKGEVDMDDTGSVDVALTYTELQRWLQEAGIDPDRLPESQFDGPDPGVARLFPIDGGLAHTASMETNVGARHIALISGMEDCMEFLAAVDGDRPALDGIRLVELLACRGGCINGPGVMSEMDQFSRKTRVIQYLEEATVNEETRRRDPEDVRLDTLTLSHVDCSKTTHNRKQALREPSEAELKDILARTGKTTPEDELNCGACGYGSCREKAVAVYSGLADIQMCMPYMRSRAESMSNAVVDYSPNGVLVVDRRGNIVETNAAFERMFSCKAAAVCGKPLATLFDPRDYLSVFSEKRPIRLSTAYPEFRIATEQVIFYIPRQDVAVGLIADVTEDEKRRDEMFKLKSATMERAQEVIKKQMKVAQEIAGLLGETTGETKVLLTKIIELSRHN